MRTHQREAPERFPSHIYTSATEQRYDTEAGQDACECSDRDFV
jgi:hypothetical protein